MRKGFGVVVAATLGLAGVGVGAGGAEAAGCATSLAPLHNVPGCNLNKAVVSSTLALADSNVSGANLNKATVSGQAAFLGSDLAGANLNGATVSGLDALVNAELAGANLNKVDITAAAVGAGADLTGANLNAATIAGLGDLTGANLTGANLHGATVSGTGALTGANLTRANLSGVTTSGLDAFFGATYSHTICPDGTNSDRHGGTCAGHLNDPPAAAHVLPLAGVVSGGGCSPPGPAAQLEFMSSPSAAVAGTSFLVSAAVTDLSGCIETADTSTSVALELGTSGTSGTSGAGGAVSSNPLSCAPHTGTAPAPNTATVFDGIADFDCTIAAPGTGYTLSATATTAGGSTLGPVTSGSFDVSGAPPAPPPPPPGTVLSGGGLNLDGYCARFGWAASHVPGIGLAIAYGGSNTEFGPNQAFDWYCVNAGGTAGEPINIQAACDAEYGPGTVAYLANPNDAYTWSCDTLAGATSTSTFTITNGGYYGALSDSTTLLADGGFGSSGSLPDFVDLGPDGTLMADGSLGGSSGLPDIIDSSGDGSSVTYSTPTGGFEVAESGSLATGGAV